jgi:hypothetical protein
LSFFVSEKQEGRPQLRPRVHERGADLDPSQPRVDPDHQPGRVQRILILQLGLRKARAAQRKTLKNRNKNREEIRKKSLEEEP